MAWSGFAVSAGFVLSEQISLPEFCWSFWLSGLVYSWTLVICGCARIFLSPMSETLWVTMKIPCVRDWQERWQKLLLCLMGLVAATVVGYLYTWLFAFYGLFLSVFARMEPLEYFGENGFINSDFHTPVLLLLGKYWPIVVGTLLAGLREIFDENPWRLLVKPFNSRVVMIHVMVLAVPFLSILAWLLFRESYQPIVIVVLLGIFTLLFQRPDLSQKPLPEQSDTGKNGH